MKIFEFFEEPIAGYEDPKEDNSRLTLDDSRKTRLTLAQLNRLRMMNDIRKLEHEQHLKQVSRQYKPPVEGGAGGAGAGASL